MKIYSDGKMVEVAGGASQDIYSTEERRIGTWIDGKPLYQRTFKLVVPYENIPEGFWYLLLNTKINDLDTLAKIQYSIYNLNAKIYLSIPYYDSAAYAMINYFLPGNEVGIGEGFGIFTNVKTIFSGPLTINAYYTKTTDQATIEVPAVLTEKPAENDPFAYDTGLDDIPAVAATTPIISEEV